MKFQSGYHNFYDEDGRLHKDHPGYKELICAKCKKLFLLGKDRHDPFCMTPECENSGDDPIPALK